MENKLGEARIYSIYLHACICKKKGTMTKSQKLIKMVTSKKGGVGNWVEETEM